MTTALVTGGGGFLGGEIVRQLHAKGIRIRSFSRSKYAWLDDYGVESITGDLANRDDVMRAVEGVDVVITSLQKWRMGWERHRDINVVGTENVLHTCRPFNAAFSLRAPQGTHAGADIAGADGCRIRPILRRITLKQKRRSRWSWGQTASICGLSR